MQIRLDLMQTCITIYSNDDAAGPGRLGSTIRISFCKDRKSRVSDFGLGRIVVDKVSPLRRKRLFLFQMPSKFENQIGRLIKQRFGQFYIARNVRPKWLTSSTGTRLELDFYIPELRLAFEVQGGQHAAYSPIFHREYSDFTEQLRRDREKREICRDRDIELVEIWHSDDFEEKAPSYEAVIEKQRRSCLIQYILRRCAVTIQCVGNIHIKIATSKRPSRRMFRSLAAVSEQLRFETILAIQEFNGDIQPKLKGRERWYRYKVERNKNTRERKPRKRLHNRLYV